MPDTLTLRTRNQAINDWIKRSDKMDRTSGPTKSNQNVELVPELVKDVVFIYGSSWGLYLLWQIQAPTGTINK
jgi:hypothetical protein